MFNCKYIFTTFNPKNMQTNCIRKVRPTNMEVTSLLLGWQKCEIPAELISKMFYFHWVSIPIIRYILRQVHAAIIKTNWRQTCGYMPPATNCSNLAEPPSSWSSSWTAGLELPGMGDPPLWFLRRLGVVPHYLFLIRPLMNRLLTKILET